MNTINEKMVNGNHERILREEVEERAKQELARKEEKRMIINGLVLVALIILATISIIQLFVVHTEETNEYGSYQCNGGLVKVCSGSYEAYEFK